MPPGHHSHSSHHSHHSSHHHSHSSHSSSSRHGGSHSYATRYVTKTRQVPRPDRARTNQPTNYSGTRLTRKHKCRTHDYIYYGESWVDNTTGVEYKKGYYDENGARYDALILEGDGYLESQFDCEFCGTSTKERWTEGSIPHCPNCGSLLYETNAILARDVIDNSFVNQQYQEMVQEPVNSRGSYLVPIITFVAMTTTFIGMAIPMLSSMSKSSGNSSSNSSYYNSNLELFGDTIYVESIGREIYWNDQYDSYYDSVSDCYAWYNTDMEPNVWQYWYEDISSDFDEDYGWMEYELDEDQWYIEVGDNDWIALPSRYDTSSLWHMTGSTAGTSYSDDYDLEMLGVSVTVDGGTASYVWDDEMLGYYVIDHGCFIYLNFDMSPTVVQYWYDSISSEYENDGVGGWMEYSSAEDCWYVEDSNGEWQQLDDSYNSLWRVEQCVEGYTGTVIMVQ